MGSKDLIAAERIILAKRMSLPALIHQNAAKVGVARELDAEHVPNLALGPVRARPNRDRRRNFFALAKRGPSPGSGSLVCE